MSIKFVFKYNKSTGRVAHPGPDLYWPEQPAIHMGLQYIGCRDEKRQQNTMPGQKAIIKEKSIHTYNLGK